MSIRLLIAMIALLGHCALWVTVFNRMNAWGHRGVQFVEKTVFLILSAPFLWAVGHITAGTTTTIVMDPPSWAVFYCLACSVGLLLKTPLWIEQRWADGQTPPSLLAIGSNEVDIRQQMGRLPARGRGRLWAMLPGNESWKLSVERKTLWIPHLPDPLSGISITHLSDLHLTGMVALEYFDHVIEQANSLQSDMVFLTGDLVDHPSCLPWVERLLGRLQAPLGVYFVLGNHDARVGEDAVRRAATDAGLISLGGRSEIVEARGRQVLLAGDERPWFGAEPALPDWDDASLRILLAHTPDQYNWARRRGFDAMFAGHTHGGQVRVPWIGPVFSPSLHGTRYASGVFDEPPTVMHVSRGVSGLQPLRWRCLPEVSRITLAANLESLARPEKTAQQESEDVAVATA